MRNKILAGFLGLALLWFFWQDWELGKEVAALQLQQEALPQVRAQQQQLAAQQQQLMGALVELIRRTGNTNMLAARP